MIIALIAIGALFLIWVGLPLAATACMVAFWLVLWYGGLWLL